MKIQTGPLGGIGRPALNKLRRQRLFEDGVCAFCAREPRLDDGVLGEACRDQHNRARRIKRPAKKTGPKPRQWKVAA